MRLLTAAAPSRHSRGLAAPKGSRPGKRLPASACVRRNSSLHSLERLLISSIWSVLEIKLGTISGSLSQLLYLLFKNDSALPGSTNAVRGLLHSGYTAFERQVSHKSRQLEQSHPACRGNISFYRDTSKDTMKQPSSPRSEIFIVRGSQAAPLEYQ
jgi:hypothetical protein